MPSTEEARVITRGAFHSTKWVFVTKNVTFDSGDVGDVSQYVKSMETIMTYIGRSNGSGREAGSNLPGGQEDIHP